MTVYPERKNAAIAVTWRTPTGHARSLNLGCHALRVIETQSGLPDTSNGRSPLSFAFRCRCSWPSRQKWESIAGGGGGPMCKPSSALSP